MTSRLVKDTIHFVGLLSNVDKSILKLSLKHGIVIEYKSTLEAINFLAQIKGTDAGNVHRELSESSCINGSEGRVYLVKKTITADVLQSQQFIGTPEHLSKFDNEIVNEYLHPLFQKMRLFKDGNIYMPTRYYYRDYGGNPRVFRSQGTILHVSREKYVLKDAEMGALNDFIRKMKIPISSEFLKLAFENFELSFNVLPHNLAFLLLMISLEAMFNPGKEEIRYRISRSLAVLLGNNKSESELIFKSVRDLYDKRSKLVHNGSNTITVTDVSEMRSFVRKSIKILAFVDKSKDEILLELNTVGFGTHPFST